MAKKTLEDRIKRLSESLRKAQARKRKAEAQKAIDAKIALADAVIGHALKDDKARIYATSRINAIREDLRPSLLKAITPPTEKAEAKTETDSEAS